MDHKFVMIPEHEELAHESVWRRFILMFDETFHLWMAGEISHEEMEEVGESFRGNTLGTVPNAETFPSCLSPEWNLKYDIKFCRQRLLNTLVSITKIQKGRMQKEGRSEAEYRLAVYQDCMMSDSWEDPDYDPGIRRPSTRELLPELFAMAEEWERSKNKPDVNHDCEDPRPDID